LAFFDEGDEPRAPRPRRPAGGIGAPDPQQARIRQAVAAGVALLVIILLVVGIKGCLSSAKKQSLKDYNRDVTAVIQESDQQVGKPLFEQLASGTSTGDAINLETQVNQLRVVADDQLKRAHGFNVPDDVSRAQGFLLTVLEFRRDGIAKIAAQLPNTQATTGGEDAVNKIAGQMQAFLASDVLYSQRVIPFIKLAFDKNSITGQTIQTTQFLPNLTWLQPETVASALNASLKGGRKAGPAAPGTHGHAITNTAVNGTDLTTDSANRITAGANTTFTVTVANQGENDEQNVVVKLSIEGSGTPVTAQATIPTTSAGSESTVDIPLKSSPPIGTPVTIKVTVDPVPGEKTTSNNTSTYPALFSKG
jgi:hypothetical protein